MATYTVNKDSVSLEAFLREPIGPDSIRVVDYVVNTAETIDGLSFADQPNSAIVLEIDLYPDIDLLTNYNGKSLKNLVTGYRLEIENKSLTGPAGLMTVENIFFKDDFKDIIDVSEIDLVTIREKIKAAQQLLVYQSEAVHNNPYSIYSQNNSQFVDLNTDTSFSEIAKSMMLDGKSIDDEVELQMPLYGVASSVLDRSATSGNSDPKNSNVITYPAWLSDKKKLSAERAKAAADAQHGDTAAGYFAQTAVPGLSPGEQIAKLVLGDFVTIKNSVFESKRRVEVPKRIWEVAPDDITITFIPIFSEDLSGDGIVKEATRTSIKPQLGSKIKSLMTPQIKPRISLVKNELGKITYVVHKGDPATLKVKTCVSCYDFSKDKEYESAPDLTIEFSDGKDSQIILNQSCLNYGPYVTNITVAAFTDYGSSIGTELVVPSLKHPKYNGSYVQDILVITCVNKQEGIDIELDNIPVSNSTGVHLYRENLSVDRKSPDKLRLLGFFKPSGTKTYLDNKVMPGKIYRYFATTEIVHHKGVNQSMKLYEHYTFSGDKIVERKHITEGNFLYQPAIQKFSSTYGAPIFKLSTTVSKSILDGLVQKMKAVVTSLGDSTDLLSELQSTDNLVYKFAVYNVNRIDKTTGDEEFLGSFETGSTFKDTTSTYKMTSKYTYVFKLAILDPVGVLDLAPGDKSLTAAKILGQEITKMTGVIPGPISSDSFKVSMYLTGVEEAINVPAFLPDIEIGKVTATESGTDAILGKPALRLTWTPPTLVNNYIKSFYVMCTYNGSENVLATIPAMSSSPAYYYEDADYFNEIGKKSYYVIGRLKDMSFTPSSNKIVKVKHFDVSAAEASGASVISTIKESGIDKPLGNISEGLF